MNEQEKALIEKAAASVATEEAMKADVVARIATDAAEAAASVATDEAIKAKDDVKKPVAAAAAPEKKQEEDKPTKAAGPQPPIGFISAELVIRPEGYGHTKLLDPQATVAQVQAELESDVGFPEGSVSLAGLEGAVEVKGFLDREKRLCEYGLNAHDKVTIPLRASRFKRETPHIRFDVSTIGWTVKDGWITPEQAYAIRATEEEKELLKRMGLDPA